MKQIDATISQNVRSARGALNLSLDQLSERSGVSKSMLRQIEIGRSSPTIGVLWKIANGLKVPFTSLLSGRSVEAHIGDFASAEPLQAGADGYRLFPLVSFQPDRPVEMYYVEMDRAVTFDGEPHGGYARETVFMIDGTIEISVGPERLRVEARQFMQFFAGEPHRYTNVGDGTAQLIMSIDYASEDRD